MAEWQREFRKHSSKGDVLEESLLAAWKVGCCSETVSRRAWLRKHQAREAGGLDFIQV